MHSLTTVFTAALITLTTAVPATLEARQANTCDVTVTNAGAYCNTQGCKDGFSQYVIEFDVSTQTNANNACMRECLRNPDCLSSYVSPNKKCRLYNTPLDSSNFTPGTTCSGVWNSLACAKLKGECPLAQGGFENFVKTDGYINPWSKKDSDSFGTSIELLETGQGGYSTNPNGFRFTGLNIVNEVGLTSISQNIRTKLGVPYTASYQYNFNGVSASSGSVPKAYTIQVKYCGKVLNTRTVPTTSNINVWQTVSFTFTAAKTCKDPQKRLAIVAAPRNPPNNPNGYTARIALDGVTLAAA